jgi:hypothetical protein
MYNIVTVFTGNKYHYSYVNKMYSMVQRNLHMPYNFICITDQPQHLNNNIQIISIPHDIGLEGWWIKPYMFSTGLLPIGTNLYIDLDMVIIKDIQPLFDYMPGQFLGARDYIYSLTNHSDKVNLASGLLRWETNTYNMIWERLCRDKSIRHSYPGDQEYLYHYHKDHIKFFPLDYTISYKWQYLKNQITDHTMIIDFHGHPKPHEVHLEDIVREHWHE